MERGKGETMDNKSSELTQYLVCYFKMVLLEAGLNWKSDNDAEMQTLAEDITGNRAGNKIDEEYLAEHDIQAIVIAVKD